jgi:hypothetical protein
MSDVTIEQLSPSALQTLHAQVRASIEEDLKKDNAVSLAKFKDELRQNNDLEIQAAIKQFEENEAKARQPLTPAEITTLLNQEYASFTFKVIAKTSDQDPERQIEFTLSELPQKVEKKFYSMVTKTLERFAKEFTADSFKFADDKADLADKIFQIAQIFEPSLDLLAEACVLCLNPRNKQSWLTKDWIQDNFSSNRIFQIVKAQVEVNKLRSFLSEVFQGLSSKNPWNQADAQLLQQ